MRKKFEGQIHNDTPLGWDSLTKENPQMRSELLSILRISNPNNFRLVTHKNYCCCEYSGRINIFTFRKIKFGIPMTVIALPVSVCSNGYTGDLKSLVNDYKGRQGLFLILNIAGRPNATDIDAAVGETLGTCIFENSFTDFDDYLASLKSGYRRRIKIACEKGKSLVWKTIENTNFTDDMHKLYLGVHEKSLYPLECLTADFFRMHPGEIFCLFEADKPLAFVLLQEENSCLSFIFGGMDYGKRDQYDLYMNMLIFITAECIKRKIPLADLGQTAEDSKLRLGAHYSKRYLCVFHRNRLINALLKRAVIAFEYKRTKPSYSVWKSVWNSVNTGTDPLFTFEHG